MTDLHTRLGDALRDQWTPSTVVYGTDEPVGFHSPSEWADHVADALLSLPDIAIVDREGLAKAITSGIQNYAGGESEAYSYHGDGSAHEAMNRLFDDAPRIAQYVFTHPLLVAANTAEQSA